MQAILEFKPNNYFEQRLFIAKSPCYSDALEREIKQYFTKIFNGVGVVHVLYYDVISNMDVDGDVDVYIGGKVINFNFDLLGNAEEL